jgi:lysophospholipase L1-like esterase
VFTGRIAVKLITVLALTSLTWPCCWGADESTDRWQSAIDAFARDDASGSQQSATAVFVGSSTIRLWDLDKWFGTQKPVPLNRGFGGSQFCDVAKHLDRLVIRHAPRVVVLYSGDNDLAAGKSVAEVHGDFATIVDGIRKKLPETSVVVLSPKASIARWKLRESYLQLNDMLRQTCASDNKLVYVDTWNTTLGDNGLPDPKFFAADGLHLSDEGYRRWTALVEPHLSVAAE